MKSEYIEEDKLRSDWKEVCEQANNFTFYSKASGSRYLEPENIADYWIEKIKQTHNNALKVAVEETEKIDTPIFEGATGFTYNAGWDDGEKSARYHLKQEIIEAITNINNKKV